MGTGLSAHHRQQHTRSKVFLGVPVLICLLILWQTQHLYGTCKAPAHVQDVESLQAYLLETSEAVRKRSTIAANALQQLAADIGQGGAKADKLKHELNETKSFLHGHKEKTLDLMIEVTGLREKAEQAHNRAQQKEDEARRKHDELQSTQQQLKEKEEQSRKHEEQVKQKEDELQKLQQQLKEKEEQLQKHSSGDKSNQQQSTQVPTQSGTAAVSADGAASRLHILEMAGLQCNAVKDQEFWADPLIWGYDHRAQDASECCAACHAYNAAADRGGTEKGRNSTRCNTWAFCADKEQCKERLGECWIKNQKQAFPSPPQLPPDAHAVKGWISGVIYPDDSHLQQYKDSNLVMHTSLGDIEVQLLPELAPASVRELRRMARLHAQGFSKCGNCRIYRPEPGFLVQGLLEAPGSYVAVPRFPSPQQPTTMPKGMVCWAGGTGGPHWFVNLVDQSGFKDEHLCWGQVKDLTLFEKIVTLPKRDKKPGEMNELVDHIPVRLSLKTA